MYFLNITEEKNDDDERKYESEFVLSNMMRFQLKSDKSLCDSVKHNWKIQADQSN